ncbi:MAG: cyclic nucleotide-binding domain-containing protein [Desulfobacteraceae bacterium]|jgi:hypothetical protein|nr:cyclic nucleotide-binding domain-containing protein [Desulfobacteraceae bacterium]
MRVIVRALGSGNRREREDAMEALDNALHGDIYRGLMPLLDEQSVQGFLISGRRPVTSWPGTFYSPGEALSFLLGEPDSVLNALCREVAQENPEIMAGVIHPVGLAPGITTENVRAVSQAATVLPVPPPAGRTAVSCSLGQRIRHLRAMPLCQGLKILEIARIVSRAQLITVDRGEILIHNGSVGDRVYIVCQGSLSADDSHRSGEWSAGDIVGELACMDGAAQMETVRCETKVLLLAIACGEFQQILLQLPVLALNLCAIYSRWLKVYHRRLTCTDGAANHAGA